MSTMASSELSETLKFLTDAGHLLATTAPETSAYLMSRRTELMFEHDVAPSDKQRQHVCSCCGHIMLLGQGSDLKIKHAKRSNRKSRSAYFTKCKKVQSLRVEPESRPGPTKVIACGHCGRFTEVKLPPPAPISRRKVPKASAPGVAETPSSASASQATSSQKTSANASSKKRAKSRKAGLQALLDQSNAARNTGPGLGLSLADFMAK
ncbi:hypothetical protein VTK56DRAFT_8720 [Thermocarpiscus australiensis]